MNAGGHIRPYTLHTHTTVSLYCSRFVRRSLFSATTVARFRSMFATPIRDVASRLSSVIGFGFPLEVNLTLLQVGFQLVFVEYPL